VEALEIPMRMIMGNSFCGLSAKVMALFLVVCTEKQGDKAKAREAMQHALSLNPDSPWVKFSASTLEK